MSMKRIGKKVRFMISAMMLMFLGTAAISSASSETLRMLVWEGDTPAERQQEFVKLVKEKYGVDLKLEISYVSGTDDFFPAVRDAKADIIAPGHNVPKDERFHLIGHKLVLPLNLDNIPNYKNILPDLQKSEYFTESGKVYGVPYIRGPYCLIYNTSIVKKAPDSWNILWDPEFRGKYALGDQYEENVYITALAMGMSRDDIFSYVKVNIPEFQAKLARLAADAHSLWEGVDKPEELKGLALAASWGISPPGLRETGEIWKVAETKEGIPGWMGGIMIGYSLEDKPELRRIAEEWLNYVLSNDYQTYLAKLYMPVTATVRDSLTPEQIERFRLDDPTYFEKNYILYKILDKKDRDGFKRLWERALKQRK
jgi:spermidine/putrescine-binding protein